MPSCPFLSRTACKSFPAARSVESGSRQAWNFEGMLHVSKLETSMRDPSHAVLPTPAFLCCQNAARARLQMYPATSDPWQSAPTVMCVTAWRTKSPPQSVPATSNVLIKGPRTLFARQVAANGSCAQPGGVQARFTAVLAAAVCVARRPTTTYKLVSRPGLVHTSCTRRMDAATAGALGASCPTSLLSSSVASL